MLGALKRSWSLSKGNRLRLVAIVLISGIIGAVVGAVPALFQRAGASGLGDLVSVLLNSILFTFIYSITASAYLQLNGGEGGLGGPRSAASMSTGPGPVA